MTGHELAKLLLSLPDKKVEISIDPKDTPVDQRTFGTEYHGALDQEGEIMLLFDGYINRDPRLDNIENAKRVRHLAIRKEYLDRTLKLFKDAHSFTYTELHQLIYGMSLVRQEGEMTDLELKLWEILKATSRS